MLAQAIFQEVRGVFARYSVKAHPDLCFIRAETPTPYYQPATQTIGFGFPDPAVPSGRLYFYFVQQLVGATTFAETQRAMEVPLPWTIAHEMTHHLRHFYGAPITNDFVEEQVVNCVAIALLGEHHRFRQGLPELKRWADQIYGRIRSLTPEIAPYLTGFRLETSDVLVSQGILPPAALQDARRLAAITGAATEEILLRTGRITASQLAQAQAEQAKTERYFNSHYMASLREYWLFGTEWLARYLERDDLPTLADALERYILTDDWEHSQADATRLLLEQALGSPDLLVATATATALADVAGPAAIGPLVRAMDDPRPRVQIAAMQALGRLPGGPAAGAMRARVLLTRSDDAGGQAARLLRLAGQAIAATTTASPAHRAEAAIARLPHDATAYAELATFLDGDETSILAALAALGEVGPGPLVERVMACLHADSATIRARAAGALTGSIPAVPVLVQMLADQDRMVRLAAREAIAQLDDAAWPALVAATASVPEAIAVEALGLVDQGAIPAVAARLTELAAGLKERTRRLGRVEARSAGIAGLEILTQAAGEERQRLARIALRAVGCVVNPQSLELAEKALASPDPAHRAGGRDLVRVSLGTAGRSFARLLEPTIAAASPSTAQQVLGTCARAESGLLRALTAYLVPSLLTPDQADRLLRRLATDPDQLVQEEAKGSLKRLRSLVESPMLTSIEKLMFLRSVPTFAECDVETLRRVARCCIVQQFRENETILREGEPGEHFYIVAEGRIMITVDGRQIDDLGPRQYFGEMALFDGGPRSATATANMATTVLRLDRDDFNRLGQDEPDLFIGVIRVLSERLRAHMPRPDGRRGSTGGNIQHGQPGLDPPVR
jgi:HEAT repeat protein